MSRQVGVLPHPASSFAVAGYRYVWLTGWVWHVARWMAVFATTYRVNAQTDDPLLVQLVGVSFMAPMFFGGALAGTLTDRIDRHRAVITTLSVLIPGAGLMALAVSADRAPIGVSYLFVFAVGIGNVVDMTTRRSLAFGLVGVGLITNAAALETFALHAGNMVGSLVGGALIDASGTASVYLGVGLLYLVAIASLTRAALHTEAQPGDGLAGTTEGPGDDEGAGAVAADTSLIDEWTAAVGLLRTNPALRQFLVTTVVMNFFYYAFVPLIPAFAEDLGVGPLLTGVLAASVGTGSMIGAFAASRLQLRRRGLVHVGGAAGAMTMLFLFANLTWYPAALAALFVAGLFGSGFGATQSALVVSLVSEDHRGRALGVLSMAIGSLPFGMLSLGLIARRTAPQLALSISVAVGLAMLVGFHLVRPSPRHLE